LSQQFLDITYYKLGKFPPCTLLVLTEPICIATGDIKSAAGGVPALVHLTGELQEYTYSEVSLPQKGEIRHPLGRTPVLLTSGNSSSVTET
jgi:hypothetical protein